MTEDGIDKSKVQPSKFDRLLIAQAGSDDLTLVTPDQDLHRYGIEVLW